jgi:hypothetical protein
MLVFSIQHAEKDTDLRKEIITTPRVKVNKAFVSFGMWDDIIELQLDLKYNVETYMSILKRDHDLKAVVQMLCIVIDMRRFFLH